MDFNAIHKSTLYNEIVDKNNLIESLNTLSETLEEHKTNLEGWHSSHSLVKKYHKKTDITIDLSQINGNEIALSNLLRIVIEQLENETYRTTKQRDELIAESYKAKNQIK